MAEVILEQRVTNLEEMMAELTQNVRQLSHNLDLSQARIEADLAAYREENRLSRERMETERQADARQWNRQYGELANKMGTMVEDLVAPSLPRILGEVIACPEDEGISMAVRVRRSLPGQRGVMQEFDAVAGCGEYALFNETKSRLATADIDDLIDKLSTVRDYFPEYQHHRLIGAVATLYMDPSVARYATRQGILALALGDDLMDMVNGPEFQLREF